MRARTSVDCPNGVRNPHHDGTDERAGCRPTTRDRPACQQVIAERGFERTRMSDIADAMGVTAPLLLHYFASKNELLTAALVSSDEPYLEDLRTEVPSRR